MLCFLAVSAGTSCTLNRRSFRCKQPFRGEGKIHVLCSLSWEATANTVESGNRCEGSTEYAAFCLCVLWYLCCPTEWPCCSMPGCGLVLAWSHSSRRLEHRRVCSGQHTIVTRDPKSHCVQANTDHCSHTATYQRVGLMWISVFLV